MSRPRAGLTIIATGLALAGCAPEPSAEGAASGSGLRIGIEEIEAPQVFQTEGTARIGGADTAAGLWAAAPGLLRPERARIVSAATGASVTVSLFRATGSNILISRATAEAIGIDAPSRVRVTAVRSEPRVLAFDSR